MKSIFIIFALAFPWAATAQNILCKDLSMLEQLVKYGDLFIGEMHGTVEVPQFFECLIEKAIEHSNEEIIVSLEMAEHVKNPISPFWENGGFMEDGRSSEAMYELVQYLVGKSNLGLVKLHFQHGIGGSPLPRNLGNELKGLAENSQVIALAGNMHSRKKPPPRYSAMDVEGMFVGPTFTHVMVVSTGGGSAWNCSGICRVNTVAPWLVDGVRTDSLIDGENYEHDFIYFLPDENVTASMPMDIESD